MQIAIIGPNTTTCTPAIASFGLTLGQSLADLGHHLICGGKGGVMQAVCQGVQSSQAHPRGMCIGILPESGLQSANPYCDVILPSGIGLARNTLVVLGGEIVIAIGGGAGTLSELAYAWQFGKTVLCVTGYGGWSEQLAGNTLDQRFDHLLIPVAGIPEILQYIQHES